MPAKTVKDLIEFNNGVSDDFKVGIRFTISKTYMRVSFCSLKTGEKIEEQNHPLRSSYYKSWEKDWHKRLGAKPDTTGGLFTRYIEPSDKPLFPWGLASCKANEKKDKYNCNNAWFVGSTNAAKGYGPMLYDCLLVKLGEQGMGLISDRTLVSPEAASVWSHYLENRKDIVAKPLDLTGATPEKEDDCYSHHKQDPDWNVWIKDPKKLAGQSDEDYEKLKKKYESMRKAVSYAYFDNGIKTLDEIKQAGLLVERVSENHSPLEELNKLYESFLRDLK